MILLVDNYDSFVYNLARYIEELGFETRVVRNDEVSLIAIQQQLRPSHIILSPGPCTPNEAGICLSLVQAYAASIPMLGVCLGHQVIAQACGADIVRAKRPMHGKASLIWHDGSGVFQDLANPLLIGRYHSLVVDPDSLPADFIVTAHSEEGEIMAIRHRQLALCGVQFHPESVLTQSGKHMLANWLGVADSGLLQHIDGEFSFAG